MPAYGDTPSNGRKRASSRGSCGGHGSGGDGSDAWSLLHLGVLPNLTRRDGTGAAAGYHPNALILAGVLILSAQAVALVQLQRAVAERAREHTRHRAFFREEAFANPAPPTELRGPALLYCYSGFIYKG